MTKNFNDFIIDEIRKSENLFYDKNSLQYAAGHEDALINFRVGARCLYGDETAEHMYKVALGYMMKHLSFIITGHPCNNKIGESLTDIAIYCFILKYFASVAREEIERNEKAPNNQSTGVIIK